MDKTWVELDGQRRSIRPGTTLNELINASGGGPGAANPVVLGMVNGRRSHLGEQLWGEERIVSIRLDDPEVHSTTQRTLCTVLSVACEEIFPRAPLAIEFGYGGGVYCALQREEPVTEGEIHTVETRMREIIARDLPLIPRLFGPQALAGMLGDTAHEHTRLAARHVRLDHAPLTRVEGSRQIFAGLHLPSTGYLRSFSLLPEPPGMVLLPSLPGDPDAVVPFAPQPKLLAAMREYALWTEEQGMANLGSINRFIEQGRVKELIRVCEARHDQVIVQTADRVAALPEEGRVVLVAGPSSSGKTSFAKRLSLQLRVLGLRPFALSLTTSSIAKKPRATPTGSTTSKAWAP